MFHTISPRVAATAAVTIGALTVYGYTKSNTTSVMVRTDEKTHKHLISMKHPRALFQPEKIEIVEVDHAYLPCLSHKGYIVRSKEVTSITSEPQSILEVEGRIKEHADDFFNACKTTIKYPVGFSTKKETTERLTPAEFPRTDSGSSIADIRTHVRSL